MTHPAKSVGLDRQLVYGLLFVAIIVLVIVGTVAKYRGVFESTVSVAVETDRAGLTLAAGAPIKLRGVEVGSVGEITTEDDVVRVELKIDSDKVDRVPADVTAQIIPPTAFGAKYVQLTPAASASGERIAAGATIRADKVTVEINEAFENLTQVLDVARPAEVSSALTAVAGAVEERGELIGRLITQTDDYLRSFNPSLRTLSDDLRVADDVADVYDLARPDLIDALAQAGTVSTTLVRQQASIRALEQSLTGFSEDADTLLRNSSTDLTRSLRLLAPVTKVLARYSPELPCTVLGLANANKLAENAVGGTHNGVTTITRLIPGRKPYSYEENLPQIGADSGPQCVGLPYVDAVEAEQQPPLMQTGANPYVGEQPNPADGVVSTLLGLLKGVVQLP